MPTFPEVVPLVHKTPGTEEANYNGTGFLINLDGENVLVTCKHILHEESDVENYFRYQETEYLINVNSEEYLDGGYHDNQIRADQGKLTVYVDDYSFYKTQNLEIESILSMLPTTEVREHEALIIVTHDCETGNQINLDCTRYGTAEHASVRVADVNNQGVDHLNMIQLNSTEHLGGHSGGAIIHVESNNCIGFLHSGSGNKVSIIKAQTIPERFHELNV